MREGDALAAVEDGEVMQLCRTLRQQFVEVGEARLENQREDLQDASLAMGLHPHLQKRRRTPGGLPGASDAGAHFTPSESELSLVRTWPSAVRGGRTSCTSRQIVSDGVPTSWGDPAGLQVPSGPCQAALSADILLPPDLETMDLLHGGPCAPCDARCGTGIVGHPPAVCGANGKKPGVVWTVPRIDLGDAGVLDAKLLTEQLDLLRESAVLGCPSGARVQGVGRPAAGRHDSVLGQGNDVQNGGFDVSGLPRR